MADHSVSKDPRSEANADRTGGVGDNADLDVGGRAWRKRLGSIRESPSRVVVVACVMFNLSGLGVAISNVSYREAPLVDKLWQILSSALYVGILSVALGFIVLPFVCLWRWIDRERMTRKDRREESQRKLSDRTLITRELDEYREN